jgi:hypothetical protein
MGTGIFSTSFIVVQLSELITISCNFLKSPFVTFCMADAVIYHWIAGEQVFPDDLKDIFLFDFFLHRTHPQGQTVLHPLLWPMFLNTHVRGGRPRKITTRYSQ